MQTRAFKNKRKRLLSIILSFVFLVFILFGVYYIFISSSSTPKSSVEPSQDYDIQAFNENVIAYDSFLSSFSNKLKSLPFSKDSSYYNEFKSLIDENSSLQAKLYAVDNPDALSSSALELSKKISSHSVFIKNLILKGKTSGDQHELAYEQYLFARQSYIDSLDDYVVDIQDSHPDFSASLSSHSDSLSSLPLSLSEQILSLEDTKLKEEMELQSDEINEYAEVVNPIIIEISSIVMEHTEELAFALQNRDYIYSSSFAQMQWHLQESYMEQRKMFEEVIPPSSILDYHKKVEDSLSLLSYKHFALVPDQTLDDIDSISNDVYEFAVDFAESTDELSKHIHKK